MKLQEKVINFYENEENSKQLPAKKDVKSVREEDREKSNAKETWMAQVGIEPTTFCIPGNSGDVGSIPTWAVIFSFTIF